MTWFNLNEKDVPDQTSSMEGAKETGEVTFCPLCLERGKNMRLRLFQINAKEALLLCSDTVCTYPMGLKPSKDIVIRRESSAAGVPQKRKLPIKPQPPKRLKLTTAAEQKCEPMTLSSNSFGRSALSGNSKGNVKPNTLKSVIGETTTKPYLSKTQARSFPTKKVETVALQLQSNIVPNSELQTAIKITTAPVSQKAVCQDTNISESSSTTLSTKHESSVPCFLQWKNKENLCWLDVILCLLVHNKWIQDHCLRENVEDSSLVRLAKFYRDATDLFKMDPASESGTQLLVNNQQHSLCNQTKASSLTNGVDGTTSVADQTKLAKVFLDRAEVILSKGRDNMWRHLQPKLRCVQGAEDSAVCALMALLSTEPHELRELCKVPYQIEVACSLCGNKRVNILEKRVLVVPAVEKSFTMANPRFTAKCEKCNATGQEVKMGLQKYPAVLFCHFVAGLSDFGRLTNLDFTSPEGSRYIVKGVVQYRRKPDHFVAWIRDVNSGLWMECDDMKESRCSFKHQNPGFPSSQIHLVMWERLPDEIRVNIPATAKVTEKLHCLSSLEKPSTKGLVQHRAIQTITGASKLSELRNSSDSLVKNESSMQLSNGLSSSPSKESRGNQADVSTANPMKIQAANATSRPEETDTNTPEIIAPSFSKNARLARMQQRFQEKHKVGNIPGHMPDVLQLHTKSMTSAPSLQASQMSNGDAKKLIKPLLTSAVLPEKKKALVSNGTVTKTEVQQECNTQPGSSTASVNSEKGQTASKDSSPKETLKSAMVHSDIQSQLSSTLSHRVLKYLPQHIHASLPFEFGVIEPNAKQPEKTVKPGVSGTFAGYVPKREVQKDEEVPSSSGKKKLSAAEKKATKGQLGRKKNVHFTIVTKDKSDVEKKADVQKQITASASTPSPSSSTYPCSNVLKKLATNRLQKESLPDASSSPKSVSAGSNITVPGIVPLSNFSPIKSKLNPGAIDPGQNNVPPTIFAGETPGLDAKTYSKLKASPQTLESSVRISTIPNGNSHTMSESTISQVNPGNLNVSLGPLGNNSSDWQWAKQSSSEVPRQSQWTSPLKNMHDPHVNIVGTSDSLDQLVPDSQQYYQNPSQLGPIGFGSHSELWHRDYQRDITKSSNGTTTTQVDLTGSSVIPKPCDYSAFPTAVGSGHPTPLFGTNMTAEQFSSLSLLPKPVRVGYSMFPTSATPGQQSVLSSQFQPPASYVMGTPLRASSPVVCLR